MTLIWKDLVTTILMAITIGFSYLMVIGFNFPLISGYRGAMLVLLILGIGMCAFGSRVTGGLTSLWLITSAVLGGLAFLLIVTGLITGSKVVFLMTVGVITVLWFAATLRHVTGS